MCHKTGWFFSINFIFAYLFFVFNFKSILSEFTLKAIESCVLYFFILYPTISRSIVCFIRSNKKSNVSRCSFYLKLFILISNQRGLGFRNLHKHFQYCNMCRTTLHHDIIICCKNIKRTTIGLVFSFPNCFHELLSIIYFLYKSMHMVYNILK